MSMSKDSMIPLTALDRPIAYHRIFRTVSGSTVAAVFLSQLWYWTQRLPEDRDGWLYKTQAQMEEETGLSRREQETARKHLTERDLIDEDRRGVPATLWYCVNQQQLSDQIQRAIQNGLTVQTGMAESAKLDRAIKPLLHTETTAETTTETTSVSPPPKRRKATQISDDFEPDESTMIWLATEGFRQPDLDRELPRFIDYYAGTGKTMVDWQRTFKNWLRKSQEYGRTNGNGHTRPKPTYYKPNGGLTAEGMAAKVRGEI